MIITALAMIIGTVIVVGMLLGLLIAGVSAVAAIFMYAVKIGFVLVPLVIAFLIIRNIFIW